MSLPSSFAGTEKREKNVSRSCVALMFELWKADTLSRNSPVLIESFWSRLEARSMTAA
jgi:hypothetical protein